MGEQYDDFGNFNYGATGAAIGYNLGQLQRVARLKKLTRNLEKGTPTSNMAFALAGVGGTYPYGDKQKDAEWIAILALNTMIADRYTLWSNI